MRMLFFAHSGLRYLVLVAGLAAIGYFAYAAASRSGNERVARALGGAFAGLIDLQVVIGLIMVALGLFYPALIGHIFMMIGAAVVAHGALILARGAQPPEKANSIRLAGVAVALVLIAGGILAIGRSVVGTGAPTMVF
jgi:heme A synthase